MEAKRTYQGTAMAMDTDINTAATDTAMATAEVMEAESIRTRS